MRSFAVGFGLALALGCGPSGPPPPSGPAKLEMGDEPEVWVCIDDAAHDEMIRASVRKDGDTIGKMIRSGRLLLVKKGTRVKVIEANTMTSVVEMEMGIHAGRRGVVANEFIKR